MLRQRLPAHAAAAALIGAPLLGLAAACAWPPLRAGERTQIAAIAAQPGRWYIFTVLIMLSSFLLVPAVLALMRLLGQTRPIWALLAGSLPWQRVWLPAVTSAGGQAELSVRCGYRAAFAMNAATI